MSERIEAEGASADRANGNIVTVAVCCLINTLNGFAMVGSSSLAASIASSWHAPLTVLRPALGTAFIGMAIGGFFVAPRADRVGRRNVIVASIALLAMSTAASGLATGIGALAVARLGAGIGIGSLLAVLTVAVAEHSAKRWQIPAIMALHASYPLGGVLAGLATTAPSRDSEWPMTFYWAAVASAVLIPAAVRWIPRREKPAAVSIGDSSQPLRKGGPLASEHRRQTLSLWCAFVLYSATVYLIVVEMPALSVLRGMTPKYAVHAGALVNAGSIPGMLLFGILARWIPIRPLMAAFLIVGIPLLVAFANLPVAGSLAPIAAFMIGALVMAGFLALYVVAIQLYPLEIRATGLGWAIGVGRLGIILGPLLGAGLRATGLSSAAAISALAIPVLATALVIGSFAAPNAGSHAP